MVDSPMTSAVATPPVVSSCPRVVLVGPPGAGKSTIGRRLATALNLPLVDSDDLIAQGEGKPCGQVYADYGESKFREIESGYVARALATGGVVSLGGGAVIDDTNRALLQVHTVVWIDVSPEEGIRRALGDTTRPVLDAADPEQHYRDLLAQREQFYREVATYRVRTDQRPPQRVVAEVLGILEAQ